MNPNLDQVKCVSCGKRLYKDDAYRQDDGGWVCENCAEKLSDPIVVGPENEAEELEGGE